MKRQTSMIAGAGFTAGVLILSLVVTTPAFAAKGSFLRSIERGRYIVEIASCNDCHTHGYAESGGSIAEKEWLLGDTLGWRGPWGTTYPPNLRLYLDKLTEKQWLEVARTARFRPPMPWYALQSMKKDDLLDVYRFVRHLGVAGNVAPSYLPPDQEPRGPYVLFPRHPK